MVNLLNPKAALFFLAFLPQFTSREATGDQLRLELLGLGLATMLIGLCLDLSYALTAAAIGRRSRSTRAPGRISRNRHRIVAVVYLVLAAFALITAF